MRFGLFRVRSPLLTESRLFSFPVGTEMFHFPTFPPTALCVQAEVAGHYSGFFRGFPIRRSPDRSSFTSSPGLIAGYNVLHRLLVPRHPPIALSSLLYYKDARVHCEVLNTRAAAQTNHPKMAGTESAQKDGCTPSSGEPGGDRTFRTQQRAQTDPHHPPRISTPPPSLPKIRVVLTRPAADAGSIVNVPHSRAAQPDTNGLALSALDEQARHKCSLERR